jgi:small subunit ribosomal protein S1
MGELLQAASQEYRSLRRGDVVDGVVVSVSRDEVLVDIGAKSEAIIPANELRSAQGAGLGNLQVGDPIVAVVLQPEDQEGHAILSLVKAQAERSWRELERRFAAGEAIEGEVVEHNKGGLVVAVKGARGFVPLSQVAEIRRSGMTEEQVEQKLASLKGKRVWVKIIEMNRRRNRLILSERAAVQERRAQQKERLLQELQPGEVRHGVVSSLTDFGAFVDLGGADGLIHLSELSWSQVSHPSQVLKVGDEVDVYVVSVDRENKKIALSLKRLQSEPWSRVTETHHVGQIVTGRITKLTQFGAFAEIDGGLEGLIHVSELSDERVTHPRQVVKEGDVVKLRIIRIDPARRRLGLSLRQAEGYEETEAPRVGVGTGNRSGMTEALETGSSFTPIKEDGADDRELPGAASKTRSRATVGEA